MPTYPLQAVEDLRAAVTRWQAAAAQVREAVATARAMKVTWAEIAAELGVSKQTAQERYGGAAKDELVRAWDAIERELWAIASLSGRSGGPISMLRALVGEGVVDETSAEGALELFRVRSLAVHDPKFSIDDAAADHLSNVAVPLRSKLLLLRSHWEAER